MIRRETQTPTYWHNYQVSESDLEQVTTLFIVDEQPRFADDLALEVMRHRCAAEETLIKRELAKGEVYRPDQSFDVGQTLVFPALGYLVGEVVAVRPGTPSPPSRKTRRDPPFPRTGRLPVRPPPAGPPGTLLAA